MSKLVWDQVGERYYETGIKNGVLYPQNAQGQYPTGVAWNGLTAVSEKPTGAEPTAIYADNTKYLNLYSAEEFGATIEAYTYPDEFEACDGSAELSQGISIGQQSRQAFGLCYTTQVGNDIQNEEYGYKIHILYGCKASPSERSYQTINDSPEANSLSWEIKTTPVNVTNKKPTSTVVIDTTKLPQSAAEKLKELEAILYGVDAPAFSTTSIYAVGDYVTHTDATTSKVYKCKTAITQPGEWDATKWDEVTNPGPRLPLPAEIEALFAA